MVVPFENENDVHFVQEEKTERGSNKMIAGGPLVFPHPQVVLFSIWNYLLTLVESELVQNGVRQSRAFLQRKAQQKKNTHVLKERWKQ